MDEPTAPLPTPIRRIPSWLVVGLLLSAAFGLRLFIIARTAVAARDSVSFVRYAHGLETEPLLKVLREGHQAPGYPALVLLASWPVRAWRGDAGCDTMVLSCQLVTALMATLSIIPTFLLGREIGGRKMGWIAAGVVLCLPTWLRITSDGLSEGTYLFWLATALCLGVRGLRRPGVGLFVGCGLASGIAYLTRPEGLEVVIAFGGVVLARQLFAAARQPWRQVVPQALGLGLGLLVLMGPYVAVI
ncbi:MAG TPA: glycosyltransferase family 39 protein, partial [Gemmataceae bacterium]|nr:glycosyltransferase family 39 protein [Gemmataceae bacterium]